LEAIEAHLVGPTAIAFIDGDPVVVAKGLRDFARTNPQLVIKGGVLDGKFLTADDVRKLADLESRDVLLAKVAGAMQGVLQQAISLVSAPLSQAARLFAALEQAAEQNPSLLASGPQVAAEPTDDQGAGEVTAEPTNEELAAEAGGEPSSEELVAEATQEPTNEELAASAAPPAASAAPEAPAASAAPATDSTPVAEPQAAPAAEDN
jgi:large subunit ribosomal protein L10